MDLCAETGLTPVIETARLCLRPLEPGDAAPIAAALADWEVTRWLSAPPWPYRAEDAAWFIAEGQGEHWHWAITEAGELVGVVSLAPDLGYWLRRDRHGAGLMTEAAGAVVSRALAGGAPSVVSGHFVGNSASRQVLTRLGFRDTGRERVFARPHGREVELCRMVRDGDV